MTGPADGNISQWVTNIQDRHRVGAGVDVPTPEASKSASSAAELEEEIRRSRAERAKRRSQTVGLVSPLPTGETSGEDTLRKLLGERGVKSPLEETASSNSMKTAYAPPSFGSSSPPKRTNTLLERYGGAKGPTGIASPGINGSPASLANFIGGKASGPRLGKLQGDGRTAPPEAAEYMSARALPGMTSGAGRGGTALASFLEARASGQDVVRSSSPPKIASGGASSSYSVPLPSRNDSASLAVTTQTDLSTGGRQDRATSPLKEGQAVTIKQPHLETLKPMNTYNTPTSDTSEIMPPASAPANSISPAFKATQAGNDRMPTASLTRLKSKKMVEQRVREAQERAGTDPSPSSSPVLRSAPAWMASNQDKPEVEPPPAGVKGRWPVAADKQPSPTRETKNFFTSAAFGNALPGIGQSRTQPTRNLYASNRRDDEGKEDVYSPPVRLPGMGSAQSPFAARSAAVEAKESSEEETQPLEQLAKGRAKPKRMTRTAAIEETAKVPVAKAEPEAEERISRQDFSAARDTFSHARRTPSPRKPQLHISMEPATPTQPTRQDSVPDSADKRLADSTAALEALLEGKREKTPTLEKSKMIFVPDKIKQAGTLKIARNKDGHAVIDTSAVQRSATKGYGSSISTTVSVDVSLIKPDGSLQALQGEDAKVLYEMETQVIIYRYKDPTSSTSVSTKVFARTGSRSRLLVDPGCLEAKKVQELGKLHRTNIIDARQGRESVELAKVMGGFLVTREGSRRDSAKETTGMYQVRGHDGAHFIDQVDILTSSLCSAHSAVIILPEHTFVWHGVGSRASTRQLALQYAHQLKSDSRQTSKISECEEGREEQIFWTSLDKSTPYSNAWHHRFALHLEESDLQPRLFSIQGTGNAKRLFDQTDFSLVDVRRDGIHILQLPLEVYVLIGPDARSRRKEIQICIEAAHTLAKEISQRRGLSIMTPPVHVVVFPTIPPRELKSAFRYWHDEHLNGKGWQRAGLGMNVWERQSALHQLDIHEFPLWQVNDELFLPVGVGLEDVQGIDV